ncbi:Hypothetical protein SRAE_X000014600 [Strongyloides ratti]|uniref:Uncharacterized protein n=1 Tax=Strongyloides ratti TaxID=34506 RepID=A0A090LM64_STRRB|nr:Hypothetical protein SRAE_X000014600 [Strongyloides ratti]CEF70816.1 Hypothetical protein SRAE_X000014600 [Strongyloides ratti]
MESKDLEKKSDIGKEVPKKDSNENKNIVKEKNDKLTIKKDMKKDEGNITDNVKYSQKNVTIELNKKNFDSSKSVSSYFSEDENCGQKKEKCKQKIRRYNYCKYHEDERDGKLMTKKEIIDKWHRSELKSAFHAMVDDARKKFLEEPEISTTPLMTSASNEKEKTKSDVILSKSSPDIKVTDGKKDNNTNVVSQKIISDGKGELKTDRVLSKSLIHDGTSDVVSFKVTSNEKEEPKDDTLLSKLPVNDSTSNGKDELKNDTVLSKLPVNDSTSNGKDELKNNTSEYYEENDIVMSTVDDNIVDEEEGNRICDEINEFLMVDSDHGDELEAEITVFNDVEQKEEYVEQIEEYFEQIEDIEHKEEYVEQIEEYVEQIEEDVEQIEEDVEQIEEDVEQIEEYIEQIEEYVEQIEEYFEQIEEDIEQIEDIEHKEEDIEQIEKDVEQIEEDIQQKEEDFEQKKEDIERIEEDVEQKEEDIERIEEDIERIEEDVEQIEEDIEQKEEDVEQIEDDIEQIKEYVEQIEEDIEEIEEDIEQIEEDIDQIEEDVEQIEEDIEQKEEDVQPHIIDEILSLHPYDDISSFTLYQSVLKEVLRMNFNDEINSGSFVLSKETIKTIMSTLENQEDEKRFEEVENILYKAIYFVLKKKGEQFDRVKFIESIEEYLVNLSNLPMNFTIRKTLFCLFFLITLLTTLNERLVNVTQNLENLTGYNIFINFFVPTMKIVIKEATPKEEKSEFRIMFKLVYDRFSSNLYHNIFPLEDTISATECAIIHLLDVLKEEGIEYALTNTFFYHIVKGLTSNLDTIFFGMNKPFPRKSINGLTKKTLFTLGVVISEIGYRALRSSKCYLLFINQVLIWKKITDFIVVSVNPKGKDPLIVKLTSTFGSIENYIKNFENLLKLYFDQIEDECKGKLNNGSEIDAE